MSGRCMADAGRRLRKLSGEARAQGTVEYAVTVAAILSLAVACAAFWRAAEDGAFARLAEAAASHVLGGAGAIDIALY